MISYAQNFEDVILRRVFRDRTDGFYIDVGAMDPTADSVTKCFYDEGWSGINIEPNDWFYSKLLAERPRDINLNLALGNREESRPLYVFEKFGISTFEESNRDHFVELGYEAQTKNVRVTTLAAVCHEYVRRGIDFLKVDCEGWEKEVLIGADWLRFRPIIVVVEATAPGTTSPAWATWEPILVEDGCYEMVYFDGLNRFYLRRDHSELRCHFEVPPNPWDGFQLYSTYVAEKTAETLQTEKEGLLARVTELETVLADQQQVGIELLRVQTEAAELKRKLLSSKLWVGQLSQELAASRLR